MSLFVIFKFPAILSPVHPDARRGWNPDDRCRHLMDYIAGDTAGGTSRERRTRQVIEGSRSNAACIPECSSGLPLVLHSGIPPGRLP
ncbi:unnamed protein product, partial [Staurois parvus]